jgi:hypothetical protein
MYMQQTLLQINLLPSQCNDLTDPQPVPEHHQDQRIVTMAVSSVCPGRFPQPFDLCLRQVLAAALVFILGLFWRGIR